MAITLNTITIDAPITQGYVGPNRVTSATESTLTGVLKGDGANVALAGNADLNALLDDAPAASRGALEIGRAFVGRPAGRPSFGNALELSPFPAFGTPQVIVDGEDGTGTLYPALSDVNANGSEGAGFPCLVRLDEWFTAQNVQPGFVDSGTWQPGDDAALYVCYFSSNHSSGAGGIFLAYRVISKKDLAKGTAHLADGTEFTPWLNTAGDDLEIVFQDTVAGSQTETPEIAFDWAQGRLVMWYHNTAVANSQATGMAYSTDGASWTRAGTVADVPQGFDNYQATHTGYLRAVSDSGMMRGQAGPYREAKSWSVVGWQPYDTAAPKWLAWREAIHPPLPDGSQRHLVGFGKNLIRYAGQLWSVCGSRTGKDAEDLDGHPVYAVRVSSDGRRPVGCPRIVWEVEAGTAWAFGFSSAGSRVFVDADGTAYLYTAAIDALNGQNRIALRRADTALEAPVETGQLMPTDEEGRIIPPLHASETLWEWSAERDGMDLTAGNLTEIAGNSSQTVVPGEIADNGYEARWQITSTETALQSPPVDLTQAAGMEFEVIGLRCLDAGDEDAGDTTPEPADDRAFWFLLLIDGVQTENTARDGIFLSSRADHNPDQFLIAENNVVTSEDLANYRASIGGRIYDPKTMTIGIMRYPIPSLDGSGAFTDHWVGYLRKDDQILHAKLIPNSTGSRFTDIRAGLRFHRYGATTPPVEHRLRGARLRIWR